MAIPPPFDRRLTLAVAAGALGATDTAIFVLPSLCQLNISPLLASSRNRGVRVRYSFVEGRLDIRFAQKDRLDRVVLGIVDLGLMRSEGPGGGEGGAVEQVLDVGIRGDRRIAPEILARRKGEPALQYLLLHDLARHVLDEQHAGVLVLGLRRATPAVGEEQAGFLGRELRQFDAAVGDGGVGVLDIRDQPYTFDDHGGLLLTELVVWPSRTHIIG